LIIFIPIIANAVQPELKLVDEHLYIDYYYSSLNETSIDIELTFNRKVNSGYATIAFYDSNNNYLETKKIYCYAYEATTVENTYTTISGKVDKYEILSFDFNTSYQLIWLYHFLIPVILLFIGALLISYKEYEVEGKIVSVYAGWYHHTLRVDGEKFDEHNTIISYIPIKLSTTLNKKTKLEATISMTNRISLKVNDKLANTKK